MERARRLEYLRAMGVEAWERRNMPAPPPIEAPEPSSAAIDLDARTQPAEAPHEESAPARTAALPETPAVSAARSVASREAPARSAAQSARAQSETRYPASSRPQAPVTTGAAAEALARIPILSTARAADQPLSADVESQWDSLRAEVLSCTKCGLHSTRTQGVFGVGNRRAEWLIIGEAPGAEEDRRGEPFVGRAGQLLNAMLKAIGLPREQVFIANVLKSRPPSNRDPKPDEVAACLPYLMRQIALLQPRLMLAVGRIAAQNLLATDMALGRLRGQVHHFGELNTPLIVTYHPAYLLRSPADKRKAWEDLKFARSTFQRLASQE
jgi:DNA polymerase